MLQNGDNPCLEQQYDFSPGLDDAMAAMEAAEADELARRKQIADMLSAKQTKLNDLVSVHILYVCSSTVMSVYVWM